MKKAERKKERIADADDSLYVCKAIELFAAWLSGHQDITQEDVVSGLKQSVEAIESGEDVVEDMEFQNVQMTTEEDGELFLRRCSVLPWGGFEGMPKEKVSK